MLINITASGYYCLVSFFLQYFVKCDDAVQADIGGDMLIDDLRMTVAQQAAFDAVVRVRTSTGKSLLYLLLLSH